MSASKKAAVLAGVAVAALALGACAKPAGSGSAEAPKQQSVLALMAADATGSLHKSVETTGKSTSVTVTMTGTAAGQKLNMRGAVDLGDPHKMDMTLDDPKQGPTTVRMIGTAIYVQVPAAQRKSMNGKKWFKMDLGAENSAEMSRQFDDMDPAKGMKRLLDGKNVTVVGQETVDGVPTVHYTTTTSIDSYLGEVDGKVRKDAKAQLAKTGVKEVKIDAWVDEQYRPRQVHMLMGKQGDFTVRYTDYDKPVTVQTPPAGEVMDFATMMNQLKDLSAGN
ncbi:LppX_LprAFG lipoprotein [Plantactinospora siamensis]|uniref:LppX_LprAFG lipoprotein n=1 Tax=Plantactinospora siamensis TaxID=555372 RepID=A0ABV6P4X5_9ACTN